MTAAGYGADDIARVGALVRKEKLKLDPAIGARWKVEDVTPATLDEDFKRPPPPHRCWKITGT